MERWDLREVSIELEEIRGLQTVIWRQKKIQFLEGFDASESYAEEMGISDKKNVKS